MLVQAFLEGESADAIPVDQFIIYPAKQIPALMLPKGRFEIRAVDESVTILGRYKLMMR